MKSKYSVLQIKRTSGLNRKRLTFRGKQFFAKLVIKRLKRCLLMAESNKLLYSHYNVIRKQKVNLNARYMSILFLKKVSTNLVRSNKIEFFFKGHKRYLHWALTVKRPINIYDRMLRISTKFIGYRFRIYNGRIFRLLLVNSNHVGFRFGEFSFTRRFGLGSELHMRRKKKLK